ncbi:MAG: heavy metal translocating P-type ATPase [Phycisphaerales bacterium]
MSGVMSRVPGDTGGRPEVDITNERRGAGRVASGMFTPKGELRAAIAAGVLLGAGYVLTHVGALARVGEGLYWTSLLIGMVFGGRAAWHAIRSRKVDIDVLMVVAAGLAAYIGHPEEGALLLFLFVLSGALEDLAMARTQREIEALHTLMPKGAMVLRDGAWVEVDAQTLVAGERVKVRPGERVPADCVVVQGESSMDQSAMTGEAMPRHVVEGDELYAGTINTDDPLEARVLRGVSESSLQKILNLVTTAREQREPVQRVIDRVNEPYAVGVLVVSAVVALVWRYGVGQSWTEAATTAITLLIVASPCALVIATPTATLAGIARGARGGVLFKGGQSIERLSGMRAVCFDKTGTLTVGRPRVYEVHPVGWSDGKELLALAAGLEADSTHPIAVAVRESAAMRGIDPVAFERVDHTTAKGLRGVHGGVEVRLGSAAFVRESIPECFRARVDEVLSRVRARGHIAVVVTRGGAEGSGGGSGEAAVVIMADAVREGAGEMIEELHAMGVRPVRMLTGDHRETASRVASRLGIDLVDAELLPEDKLRIVETMQREHGSVGVIGDGVNDAPALAAASVSIGIGAIGTAAALESADIVLLSDNLRTVPWAVRLARSVRRRVAFNLSLALGVIVVMSIATLVLSYLGRPIDVGWGVVAHEGGTLAVVLNSLWLLRFPGLGRAIAGGRCMAAGKPAGNAVLVGAR